VKQNCENEQNSILERMGNGKAWKGGTALWNCGAAGEYLRKPMKKGLPHMTGEGFSLYFKLATGM
jgi:hypothetical protein